MDSTFQIQPEEFEILIVEDSPTQAERLRRLIQSKSYKARVAANGQLALALIRERKPDLVLSDIIMPGGINGFMLAREMLSRLPSLKVILTTGYAATEEHAGDAARFEHEILKKPYRLSDLARTVRRVLDEPSADQAAPVDAP